MSPDNKEHKGHSVTVVIDGTEVILTGKDLTFEEIVDIAAPGHTAPATSYSVTYKRKDGGDLKTLLVGYSVKPKDGMIFDVYLATAS